MVETATGIVLRTRLLTETSLIIQWLTPNLGRLATVAKGARRPKSPFRGKLDLFYLADFSFSRSPRSELHNLREVSLRETHSALRQELTYLQQASYCANLVEVATETETPLEAVYELFRRFLEAMIERETQPQTVLAFELKLLAELGLQPDLEPSQLTPGAKGIVRLLSTADWPVIQQLRLSPAQTAELRRFLHDFLVFHLGHLAKGREAALSGTAST
ncbi:MAG TPA: DNA repair protein RecO [Clostridia bacterium]|nr:DNA repair protein RecO [Clostridia bacterium]